jgi:hypothetical protein
VYKRALEEQYKLKMKAGRCALLGQLDMSCTNADPAKRPLATCFCMWKHVAIRFSGSPDPGRHLLEVHREQLCSTC